jgi:hypothetical protein
LGSSRARLSLLRAAGYSSGGPPGAALDTNSQGSAQDGHHAAHARLPAIAGSAGAGRGSLSLRGAGREISRFCGGDRSQPARSRAPAPDQGDPGAGRDADARVEPVRQPAGRGVRQAAVRPDVRRYGVLHQLRSRGGRVRDQDRAAVPLCEGQRAQARPDHVQERVPRPDDGGDQRDRPGQDDRRVRPASAGLQGRRVRQSRGCPGRGRRGTSRADSPSWGWSG